MLKYGFVVLVAITQLAWIVFVCWSIWQLAR